MIAEEQPSSASTLPLWTNGQSVHTGERLKWQIRKQKSLGGTGGEKGKNKALEWREGRRHGHVWVMLWGSDVHISFYSRPFSPQLQQISSWWTITALKKDITRGAVLTSYSYILPGSPHLLCSSLLMATMEESKLIISLDCHDEGPIVAFSRDKPKGRESQPDLSIGMDLDLSQSHRSHRSFLPHSPSSPGSLADLSALSAGLLATNSLVKSSSTDLDPSESSSPRGRPLLSLVKSLSTEVSWRAEPEVSLSSSDSKLHLHPWKQHPRIPEAKPDAGEVAERDVWAAAPSVEPRGSSLIAELEGKRRKFSEAMQDQLSMLSKMIGDESCSISKQGRASSVGDSPLFQSSTEKHGGGEDPALKCRRRPDGEPKGVDDPPVERPQQGSLADKAAIGMIDLRNGSRERTNTRSRVRLPGPSQPLHWLFLVGLLAYSFFVLPLPPYLTGLFVGVVCGFLLGLGAMFTFAPRRSPAKTTRGLCKQRMLDQLRGERADAKSLAVKMLHTDDSGALKEKVMNNPAFFHLPGMDEWNAQLRPWDFPPLHHALCLCDPGWEPAVPGVPAYKRAPLGWLRWVAARGLVSALLHVWAG